MGFCQELADVLCAKLAQKLKDLNSKATLKIVGSNECDHVYLHVKIRLVGESKSHWELDAWDPRIIDRTKRKGYSRKNRENLDYGVHTETLYKIKVEPKNANLIKEDIRKQTSQFDKDLLKKKLRTPRDGRCARSVTPEKDILKKHKHMHDDHTIENAFENNKLPFFFSEETIAESQTSKMQRASLWQKK